VANFQVYVDLQATDWGNYFAFPSML